MGPVKEVEKTFKEYHEAGIRVVEIPFTYNVFIKSKEVAKKVKKTAEKYRIMLTIHAPYWINLNSDEKEKVDRTPFLYPRDLQAWQPPGLQVHWGAVAPKELQQAMIDPMHDLSYRLLWHFVQIIGRQQAGVQF